MFLRQVGSKGGSRFSSRAPMRPGVAPSLLGPCLGLGTRAGFAFPARSSAPAMLPLPCRTRKAPATAASSRTQHCSDHVLRNAGVTPAYTCPRANTEGLQPPVEATKGFSGQMNKQTEKVSLSSEFTICTLAYERKQNLLEARAGSLSLWRKHNSEAEPPAPPLRT